jgi:hypothetical protein
MTRGLSHQSERRQNAELSVKLRGPSPIEHQGRSVVSVASVETARSQGRRKSCLITASGAWMAERAGSGGDH